MSDRTRPDDDDAVNDDDGKEKANDGLKSEIVDDKWGTAPGWPDDGGSDDYIVDETAPKTIDGKLDKMGAELRRLTRNSLMATLGVALLFLITDASSGHGYANTTGFVVGAGFATLNLWMLAGGYFAVVDGRAVAIRVVLSVVGAMVVLFGVALYVIFAHREWTIGFAVGLTVPALGGIVHAFDKRRD